MNKLIVLLAFLSLFIKSDLVSSNHFVSSKITISSDKRGRAPKVKTLAVPDSLWKKIEKKKRPESGYYYQVATNSKLDVALSLMGANSILILDSTGKFQFLYSFDSIPDFRLNEMDYDDNDNLLIEYNNKRNIMKISNGHFIHYNNDVPGKFLFLQSDLATFLLSNATIPVFYIDSTYTDRPELFYKTYNYYISPQDSSIYFVWPKCFALWKKGDFTGQYYQAEQADFIKTKLLYVNSLSKIAYYSNSGVLYEVSLVTGENNLVLNNQYNMRAGEYDFCNSRKTIVGISRKSSSEKLTVDFIVVR